MYTRTFVVNGSGSFPVDMLRYDCCYPESQADVQRAFCERGERVVHLVSQCGEKRHAEQIPTDDRWESFTWRVISKSTPRKI